MLSEQTIKAQLVAKSLQQAQEMEEQRAFIKALLEEVKSGNEGKKCPPLKLDLSNSETKRWCTGLDNIAVKKLELPCLVQCQGDNDSDDCIFLDEGSTYSDNKDSENDQAARSNPFNIFGFKNAQDSDSEEANSDDEVEVMQSARFGNPHLDQSGDQKCEFCAEKWHPLSACPTYFVYKHRIHMENLERRNQRRAKRA